MLDVELDRRLKTHDGHRNLLKVKGALHNPGCSRGLKPPVSSSDLAM